LGSPHDPTGTGHTIIAIDPEAFMERGEFDARFVRLREQIHDAPKANGAERIYIPGEIEIEHESRARQDGLEFDSVIWASLAAMADELDSGAELEQVLR
jgi:LDH2 family malate/lactate/ureidoglycolate dehydrogenase